MERMNFIDRIKAKFIHGDGDRISLKGTYKLKFFDKDGVLQWERDILNTIMVLGKNAILDAALAGSSYSANGPFMGLISSVGYTGAPVAGDTMASHPTWFEVDASTHFPTVAARLSTSGLWTAAAGGVKGMSGTINFSIVTNPGTVKGAFLVFGAGAVTTLGSTAGVLLSAGVFSGGDQVVSVGGTLQVSYSMTAT